MGMPAAKQGDRIVGVDIHIVMVPTPAGPVPTPLPHPFSGTLSSGLSADVNIDGKPAATVGSAAANTPPHVPMAPGTTFQIAPTNRATIVMGSTSVLINGKPAARVGDPALTCNDPVDQPLGTAVGAGTVMIG